MKKFFNEKRKKTILIYIILWLLLAIVFVIPISVAAMDSQSNGTLEMSSFGEIVLPYIIDIGTRVKAFEENYISNTKMVLIYYTIFYYLFMFILFLKNFKDDGDFHDIEHGSSDWSSGGEQYKVLSKKEGIILAEKNYLPVDKPGNINVLIVGRIWCW